LPPETPFEVWTLRWAGSISNGTLVPCHTWRPEPGGRPPILRRQASGQEEADRPGRSLQARRGPAARRHGCPLFPRWSAFILTGLLAGLRWGESAALRVGDVDWERGWLYVQRTWSDKGRRVEACKDSEMRKVKAPASLLDALRTQREAVALEGNVKGWTPEQRQLLFPTLAGQIARHGHFYEDVWKPLLAKAGLPHRKYHATRHSFATWLLDEGADVRWVQAQLGHATIAQTVDTYSHIDTARHAAGAQPLSRAVGKTRQGAAEFRD
jgi:integrase